MFKFLLVCVFCFLGVVQGDKVPKTLVLIICSDDLPEYAGFQRSWSSYMHLDPDYFECYFIRANPDMKTNFQIDKDIIWSKTQENLVPGILNKTLLSLEAMLPRLDEFDYVLRTNLSSFFIFPRLKNFLLNAPRRNFFCGIHHLLGEDWQPEGWICGAGMIMSRDLIKLLLVNKWKLFDLNKKMLITESRMLIDDVAISRFFVKKGVKIQSGKSVEIYSLEDWNGVKENIPEDIFHFRIRTLPPQTRDLDLIIHETLLEMFYNQSINLTE